MFPAIQLAEKRTLVSGTKETCLRAIVHVIPSLDTLADTPVKDVELGSPHCISVMGRWRSDVQVGQTDNPSVRFHVAWMWACLARGPRMEVLVWPSGPFTGIKYRSEIRSGVFYPFHVPILSPLRFLISAVKDFKWGFKSSSQTAVLSIFLPGPIYLSHFLCPFLCCWNSGWFSRLVIMTNTANKWCLSSVLLKGQLGVLWVNHMDCWPEYCGRSFVTFSNILC